MAASVRDVDAWREAGDGDVVLFLHGLGGSRTVWEPQLEALSDRWRCVAWDMPGYGASAPISPLTFEAIADAVNDLLDRLGVEAAHLCGLSFGGHHALHTALRHPDQVRSLVLANTSAAFGGDGTDPGEWISLRTAPLNAGLSLQAPTLVIVGELDGETPLAYAAELHSGISNSRLEVIPAIGHLSPAGAPEAFNDLVRQFWGSLPATRL